LKESYDEITPEYEFIFDTDNGIVTQNKTSSYGLQMAMIWLVGGFYAASGFMYLLSIPLVKRDLERIKILNDYN